MRRTQFQWELQLKFICWGPSDKATYHFGFSMLTDRFSSPQPTVKKKTHKTSMRLFHTRDMRGKYVVSAQRSPSTYMFTNINKTNQDFSNIKIHSYSTSLRRD